MNYKKMHLETCGVTVEMTTFATAQGLEERHAILHVAPQGEIFTRQLQRLYDAEQRLATIIQAEGKPARCVMKRYFLSDSTNQEPCMRQECGVAVSFIQQQPLDGSKVAVWMYFLCGEGVQVEERHGMVVAAHGGYQHLWKMGMHETQGDSAQQTTAVLTAYEAQLAAFGATIADNCIRTWFFVRDVDTQYAGLVAARRQNFIEQGLTEQTHYIASTGIGGSPAAPKALIQLGCYAMTGFRPEQQHYLYAPTHLNPTYEYGVTFERGTVMEYGDRAHVFISGTASINNKGEVVHIGDIVGQTRRMWENVEKLLEEADTSFDDVMQIIVYLRDTADYDIVRSMFEQRFPNTPWVITLAPVCRPTWLIEMECVAVKERQHDNYLPF
ncbi:MAG: hypothetical protein KBT12_00530 [Bacteroidales bacterium]|nr:hypothetical protein [Candidatus Physcousia equi]